MNDQIKPEVPASDNPAPCCGPSCCCNTKPKASCVRSTVVIVVLVAAAAIVGWKFLGAPTAPAAAPAGVSSPAPAPVAANLNTFQELNQVAEGQDAVLVLVPTREAGTVGDAIAGPVNATLQTLTAKGIAVGLYALAPNSPDLPALAARHALPGVLVLSRTAGKLLVADNYDAGLLTAPVTEPKLLQAYVAATLGAAGGGCNCAQGATCGGK